MTKLQASAYDTESFLEADFGILRMTVLVAFLTLAVGYSLGQLLAKADVMLRVKRSGYFNKLLIIKISEDFSFESKFIARKKLSKGSGKYARAKW